jgi:hypothetical protein
MPADGLTRHSSWGSERAPPDPVLSAERFETGQLSYAKAEEEPMDQWEEWRVSSGCSWD